MVDTRSTWWSLFPHSASRNGASTYVTSLSAKSAAKASNRMRQWAAFCSVLVCCNASWTARAPMASPGAQGETED